MPNLEFLPMAVVVLIYAVTILMSILWLLLPFAVYGTKRVLRELLSEQRRTNEMLGMLSLSLRRDPALGPGRFPDGRIEPSA